MKLVKKHNRYALAAAKAYANSKPWKGCAIEKADKLRVFHEELCGAYGIQDVDLIIDIDADVPDNAGGFITYDCPATGGAIIMKPGFAVMTYLRLFAELLTYSRDLMFAEEYDSISDYISAWANSLFKKAFPNSFQRLVDRDAPILYRNYVA